MCNRLAIQVFQAIYYQEFLKIRYNIFKHGFIFTRISKKNPALEKDGAWMDIQHLGARNQESPWQAGSLRRP
jgi:hypothetical protein